MQENLGNMDQGTTFSRAVKAQTELGFESLRVNQEFINSVPQGRLKRLGTDSAVPPGLDISP